MKINDVELRLGAIIQDHAISNRRLKIISDLLSAPTPSKTDPGDLSDALVRVEQARAALTALEEARKIARQQSGYLDLWQRIAPRRKSQTRAQRAEAQRQMYALKIAGVIVEIYTEQYGRCAYCTRALRGRYHVDHIVPVSRGGLTVRQNLCCACPPCNIRKRDQMREEFLSGGLDLTPV